MADRQNQYVGLLKVRKPFQQEYFEPKSPFKSNDLKGIVNFRMIILLTALQNRKNGLIFPKTLIINRFYIIALIGIRLFHYGDHWEPFRKNITSQVFIAVRK